MTTAKSTPLQLGYLLLLSIFVLSCSKGSTPTPISPQDQAKALLTAGTWQLQSESVDGVDHSALYTGFTIAFTSSGYTTTKGGAMWPTSGSWSFQGTDANSIVRNDGTVVQLQITASLLTMTINWPTTTLGSGRIESTNGQNVFTMKK